MQKDRTLLVRVEAVKYHHFVKLKELICEASSFRSILPYTAMYKDVFQDTGTSFSVRMCSKYDFDVVVQLLEE